MCQPLEGRADLVIVHRILSWLWPPKADRHEGGETVEGCKMQSHDGTAVLHTITGCPKISQEKEKVSGFEDEELKHLQSGHLTGNFCPTANF